MKKKNYYLIAILCIILIVGKPLIVANWNNWFHSVKTADDNTNYYTLKKVEDTCRSMISSYEFDKHTYEQYKDSDSEEKRGWAEQAKMRANKTAASYNSFVLKNNYVWKNNVPDDISEELPYLE